VLQLIQSKYYHRAIINQNDNEVTVHYGKFSLVSRELMLKFPRFMSDLKPRAGISRQAAALDALISISESPVTTVIDKRFMGVQGVFDRIIAILVSNELELKVQALAFATSLCKQCPSNLNIFFESSGSIFALVRQLK
jgi:hypothetical protein